MKFTLKVLEDEGQVFVFDKLPVAVEDVLRADKKELKEYTFTLKDPIQEKHRQEVERLMWLSTGQKDEALRGAATAVGYLENWDLPVPLTMDGFQTLHPVLAENIRLRIEAMVFPSWITNPFFSKLLKDKPEIFSQA